MPEVLYETDGHVAVITLNRPQVLNAINPALTAAMHRVMAEFEGDPAVWVGIITGAGERAFSAGADLKAIASGQGEGRSAPPGGFAGFVHHPRTKPVIAAVNGLAVGGGMEIVLACDIVLASEHAEFGLPEVSRGIIASGGGLFRLPRMIPPGRAIEMILTGDRITAQEARQLGLVSNLAPLSGLMKMARELAARICRNAPLAVRESLAIARQAGEVDDAEAWRLTEEAQRRVFQTRDAAEGVQAFAAKRQPSWRGE